MNRREYKQENLACERHPTVHSISQKISQPSQASREIQREMCSSINCTVYNSESLAYYKLLGAWRYCPGKKNKIMVTDVSLDLALFAP